MLLGRGYSRTTDSSVQLALRLVVESRYPLSSVQSALLRQAVRFLVKHHFVLDVRIINRRVFVRMVKTGYLTCSYAHRIACAHVVDVSVEAHFLVDLDLPSAHQQPRV